MFSLKAPCELEKEMCALIVDVTRFTKPTYVCSIFKAVVKNLRVHGLSLRYSAWKAFIQTSYAADLFQAVEMNSFMFLGRFCHSVLIFLQLCVPFCPYKKKKKKHYSRSTPHSF